MPTVYVPAPPAGADLVQADGTDLNVAEPTLPALHARPLPSTTAASFRRSLFSLSPKKQQSDVELAPTTDHGDCNLSSGRGDPFGTSDPAASRDPVRITTWGPDTNIYQRRPCRAKSCRRSRRLQPEGREKITGVRVTLGANEQLEISVQGREEACTTQWIEESSDGAAFRRTSVTDTRITTWYMEKAVIADDSSGGEGWESSDSSDSESSDGSSDNEDAQSNRSDEKGSKVDTAADVNDEELGKMVEKIKKFKETMNELSAAVKVMERVAEGMKRMRELGEKN